MSDLKDEFTARELSRHTKEVLAATEVFGSVTIRSRNGKAYEIRLTRSEVDFKPSREELEARFLNYDKKMTDLNYEPPPESNFEKLDSILAGEE